MDCNVNRLVFQKGAVEKVYKQGTFFVTNDSLIIPDKFLKLILGKFAYY